MDRTIIVVFSLALIQSKRGNPISYNNYYLTENPVVTFWATFIILKGKVKEY